MYNQRTNYVIVGLFVTAMLTAAAVWLVLLTGRTGPRDSYVLIFENVADVKFGTQVRYEGFPVGEVEAITPLADGARMRFRVEASISRGWQIPRDSVARITASSFLAAKTIDIASGVSPEAITAGGEIATAPAGDMFAVMATAAAELTQLNRESIRPLLATLNDLAGTLADGAPRITQDLTSVTRRMNDGLAAMQDILASDNVQAIRRVIQNAESTSDTLATTLRRTDNLARNLDELIEENRGNLDKSLEDVQYTLRSMTQTVDSIVYNLDGAARNMNEFSRLIRQNPGLLLGGSPREAVSPAASRGDSASTGEGVQ